MYRADSIIFKVHEGYCRLWGPSTEYFKRNLLGLKFDLKAQECCDKKNIENDWRWNEKRSN